MTTKLTRKTIALALVLALLVSLAVTAWGDTGPKPSVRVEFENMDDVLCYGTLLSERKSTGPSSAWDGDSDHAQHSGMEGYGHMTLDEATWQKFVDYEDADGYYFLQEGWIVSGEEELAWTYYPPDPFKILLYFPETDTFMTSGIYERYAFDSYFTVDMEQTDESGLLLAERDYRYGPELLSFLARVVLTFVIEMAVALMFGFRQKKQLLLLLAVNGGTQIILNVALSIIDYRSGFLAFVLLYILFELIVTVIEAVVYAIYLPRFSPQPKKRWVCVVYAIVANYLSFWAGLYIANHFPEIF